MTQTLEQRVAELEKQVAALSSQIESPAPRKKDPWKTLGHFKDDPDYESAMRLGREWREAQTYEKEIARS
jgi:predicted  nucleic acid-binding Zn-ribbon protein